MIVIFAEHGSFRVIVYFWVVSMHTLRTILSWLLALFLIGAFVQSNLYPFGDPPEGQIKLWDAPGENIVFQTLADRSGYALFEPAGRFVTGAVELFAAFLLLLPWTRRFGAVLAAIVMAAATALHMSSWLGREVPLSLNPGETGTDGGILFMLAIAMLVASFLLVIVHPGKRKRAY